jgi:hypothetical protein
MISASRLKQTIINFCQKYRKLIFYIALAAIVLPEVTVYFYRPNRGFDIYGYLSAGNDALRLENLYRISEPAKTIPGLHFFFFLYSTCSFSKTLRIACNKGTVVLF